MPTSCFVLTPPSGGREGGREGRKINEKRTHGKGSIYIHIDVKKKKRGEAKLAVCVCLSVCLAKQRGMSFDVRSFLLC